MHIKVKQGLDVPIKGKPQGSVTTLPTPTLSALDLSPFDTLRFNLLVKVGDEVSIGQPLAEDKACENRMFVSPSLGRIKEIVRGLKRRILSLVIEGNGTDSYFESQALDIQQASKEEIVSRLMKGGVFAHLRMRPCNRLVDPTRLPKSIFVNAVESAPFRPQAELELEGEQEAFQFGLDALAKLSDGKVHLVKRKSSPIHGEGVTLHTIEGPHPAGNTSVHIYHIDPILSSDHLIWTATVNDVITIGKLLKEGKYYPNRVISIAGEGVLPDQCSYYKVRRGMQVNELMQKRLAEGEFRLISGDPLMGEKVEGEDFLGFYHNVLCAIPNPSEKREFLHFFRPGIKKYTATRTYLSGHGPKSHQDVSFTTSQHGEERAFVDGSVYEKVMPFRISTIHLVKAFLAADYEKATQLGALEIDAEDFALPSFICPSKIAMTQIVREGLRSYVEQYLA